MKPRRRAVTGSIAALALATLAGGQYAGATSGSGGSGGGQTISVLIASSGPAETAAVQAAADAWAQATGNTAQVTAAENMNQQLGQALAGGDPPDVFYVNSDKFQEYASGGSLAAVGDQLDNPDDFYPALAQTFTYDDQLYCAPKDFSTLGLIINTDSWAAAGLTDADIPATWDDLSAVAKKLTTADQVGIATGGTRDRIGALMVAYGGYFVNEDQTEVTADTPENLAALQFLKGMLDAGTWKFTENMDLGWGGEAFGTGAAAMTIEGNWIRGAMTNDYPDINYKVVELPTGPSGNRGSMAFTQCWGVAAASDKQDAAVDFVNFVTSADQEVAVSDAIGVMPSRQSARDAYLADNPDFEPFLNAADYARAQVTLPAFTDVLIAFDQELVAMSQGDGDPETILKDLQQNGEDALNG